MTQSHVVSALVAKRAELTGLIEHHQAQMRELSASVDRLDATLKLFDQDYDVSTVKSKGFRKTNPWFSPGEMSRLALEAMRTASDPLSTCEIANALIARKGITIDGTKERDRLIKLLLGSLQRMRQRGSVEIAGRRRGPGGGPMLWKLV